MKWYVIMKFTFKDEATMKAAKKKKAWNPADEVSCGYATGNGGQGTDGNPSNHFPSVRIKMHELQKAETDPRVLYRIQSTNY